MIHPSLTQVFDSRQLVTHPAELITYEVDAGFDRGRPDAVFFPQDANDVSRVLRWANEHGTPVVARGAGTGLSGGAVAEQGGIIVEFARLNRVIELDVVGRSAVVQPGVVNLAFDGLAKEAGLYYPPDPSSGRSSVIGGNLGENAGGPHCFKYGVTTNYVTGLEVVLADGQIVRAGGKAFDYPELDFCGLWVGSEGTLMLATEATVRLIRNPPAVKTMMVSFDSDEQAGQAVSAVIAAGLLPATLEMMDRRVMRIIEDYVQIGLPVEAQAALIVEVDGHPASLDAQMEEVADILAANGGYNLCIAQSETERTQIWYGRKSAAGAFARVAPAFYLVDITVPRSRLADTLAAVNEICERNRVPVGHVFHAGDGNLHPTLFFDPRDADLKARVLQASGEIAALVVERDGSLTGEHGVGIEKRAYMPLMYSGAELAAQRDVKEIFDPRNLLNPGKIFPPDLPPVERAAPTLPTDPCIAPVSAQEAASRLAGLTEERRTVRIGGAATGNTEGVEHWLSTQRLAGIQTFAPDDLYITAGAGTLLTQVQEFLAEHGMQVALVSPWSDATLGGLVAANVNGPQRMRYGGARDNVLATTVAMADGRVIRAGRPVVKNVAGYDLTKLFVGSHGVLGLITDVTLKLTPLPRARTTLAVPVESVRQGLEWAQATTPVWFVTSGVVLCRGSRAPALADAPYALCLTLEGIAEDVDAEVEELTSALQAAGAPAPVQTPSLSAAAIWARFLGGAQPDSLVIRSGVQPKRLGEYMARLDAATLDQAEWLFDAGSGFAYAAFADSADSTDAPDVLNAVRDAALALDGYTVALQTPPGLSLDRWGYRPSALLWMQALKERWDAACILNPDAFVVG